MKSELRPRRRCHSFAAIAVALLLLLQGCKFMVGPDLGRWWEHYERGLTLASAERWEGATESFELAIRKRPDEDPHTWDDSNRKVRYLPHRELGICYYHLDSLASSPGTKVIGGQNYLDKALAELEISLTNVESEKARYYKSLVEKRMVKGKPDDAKRPVVLILNPPDGLITRINQVRVSARANDWTYVERISIADSLQDAFGGKEVTASHQVDLAAGVNKIVCIADDIFGNRGSDTITVVLDRQGPSIWIHQALSDSTASGIVNVTGSVRDDSGLRTFRVNDRDVAVDGHGRFSFRADVGGGPVFSLTGVDRVGNEHRLRIELTGPETGSLPGTRPRGFRRPSGSTLGLNRSISPSGTFRPLEWLRLLFRKFNPLTLYQSVQSSIPLIIGDLKPLPAEPSEDMTDLISLPFVTDPETPDHSAPVLDVYPNKTPTVFAEDYRLHLIAKDDVSVVTIRVNGIEVKKEDSGRVAALYHKIKLPKTGVHTFVVDAVDGSGRSTSVSVDIRRKQSSLPRLQLFVERIDTRDSGLPDSLVASLDIRSLDSELESALRAQNRFDVLNPKNTAQKDDADVVLSARLERTSEVDVWLRGQGAFAVNDETLPMPTKASMWRLARYLTRKWPRVTDGQITEPQGTAIIAEFGEHSGVTKDMPTVVFDRSNEAVIAEGAVESVAGMQYEILLEESSIREPVEIKHGIATK